MILIIYLIICFLIFLFYLLSPEEWTASEESEEGISNKKFIKKYKKDHIIYESSFEFREELDSLLYEIHDSPNNNYLNRNLLNLKRFLFNHIKVSQLSMIEFFEDFSLYDNKLRDSKQYIDLGLIYYYFYLYEIDIDYTAHNQSNNFKEAISNFLRASKAGDLLGREFLDEMYDRVKTFDIALPRYFDNEIRIELGLDPKS